LVSEGFLLSMTIIPSLFEAFLKCPIKCWLRATSEIASGNTYAEWVRTQNESFRATETERLLAEAPEGEPARSPSRENLKAGKWRLAVDIVVQATLPTPSGGASYPSPTNPGSSTNPTDSSNSGPRATRLSEVFALETRLHAVERVPSEGRGKPAEFIPIRFVFTNKLGKDDKLLLAFDGYVLSESLGRAIAAGKIIHGDDHATLKVKTAALAGEVRKRLEKIAALLSSHAPPDLVLNRHCAECQFQAWCRQKALEKDDLSLLARMSEKERKKLHSKGIFTVTQLSYTFRPRRRPKRLRDKRERYHHSLKALAIREKKIHIVGSPELKIEGTPVYLDVEGLPDRDFYYLIGVRIGDGESAVQHSLWADSTQDEKRIWNEFLDILASVKEPVLVHYGSYETTFLARMTARHGNPPEGSGAMKAIAGAVNLVSVIFAQIYLPTLSNGLKDLAAWFGFKWSGPIQAGTHAIALRQQWEQQAEALLKRNLTSYNSEDCQALALVAKAVAQACGRDAAANTADHPLCDVINADSLPKQNTMWRKFTSPIPAFEEINKAARWDYQRDRIYIRTNNRLKRAAKAQSRTSRGAMRINEEIICERPRVCPHCKRKGMKLLYGAARILCDLRFSKYGLRRWIVKYHFRSYYCAGCRVCFGKPKEFWQGTKYGRNVAALLIFKTVDLCMKQRTIAQELNRLYQLRLPERQVHRFKARAADFYEDSRRKILTEMVKGAVIHADETRIALHTKSAYVWVFATFREVAYFYAESREGDLPLKLLDGFEGVLVSDFYAAYDSLPCSQQKCLLHLMRDLNDAVLNDPYDEEIKEIVTSFAILLNGIVETTDRWGLKCHFLRKHLLDVDRFYRQLSRASYHSEAALKCKERFEKNREKLFTFLNHSGVPWNNNNAEHAIKAFARLRRAIDGLSTPEGIEDYLVLLSVCQTCKYMGVDFLDFLRSGEKDIHAFAESRRGRRRRSPRSEPNIGGHIGGQY